MNEVLPAEVADKDKTIESLKSSNIKPDLRFKIIEIQ